MLVLLTLFFMAIVAYAGLREGLLTAACTLMNILFAGLCAFWLFEPLANALEDILRGSILAGSEDALALASLFVPVFMGLKAITGQWSSNVPDYPVIVDRAGSGILGAIAGYLLAGFLVCVFQTLPWGPNFMGYQYAVDPTAPGAAARRFLPPDRVWLAMMNRASEGSFSVGGHAGFDPDGSFSLRYARYRRKAPEMK